ncbi:DUF2141 domain-containing protein [Maricaulis parjimensis]|uniref:DUF2141 domain-containing protein n=1 Tax=Maricaulis parjimensis TaxID=144023 RepID=UPI00193A9DB2|nr:DUF2141 domain-containing protein [Maricaulis parjimensis]
MMTSMMTAALMTALLSLGADSDASLTVTVEGLQTPEGAVMMALYADEASWNGGDAVEGRRVVVQGLTATVEFASLPAGDYAIRMFHDVDGDGELDTNLMGIPSEPFAFSNNARGNFGPASWADAVFTVSPGGNAHALDLQ